ncbi:hypothetical protein J6590_073944 [Homalodisca vitripennis]|nr:hypothetical protein J6590_073944 [Homalodisca vitripennis]
MEQYNRRTNIEISGVAVTPQEGIVSIVKDVGATIGNQRLSPRQTQSFPPLLRSPPASMVMSPVTEEEIATVIRDSPSKKSNDLNYVST